jgi:integrase
MPRRKGIPGYRLHKPSGQARVIIDGCHVYLGPYDSPESRKKYQETVRKHLAERTKAEMERTIEFATDVTVSEILVRYIPHVESYYKKHGEPTGQVSIIRLSLRVLRGKFGHLEATAFGPKALKECRAEFIRQGLCRNEVNRRTSLVRQFFKWAVSEEILPSSVWHGLQAVSGLRKNRSEAPDRDPVLPVPEAIVDATLPHLPRAVAAMVRLQLLAGMRPDEVVQMRGCDLATGAPVWEYRPGSHKMEHKDKSRVIMLGPRAQAIVKEWLKTDLEAFLFSPRESVAEQRTDRRETRKTPMWPSHEATQAKKRKDRPRRVPRDHYDVVSYRRAIHRACDRAFPHSVLSSIAEKDQTDDQLAELEAWRKEHRWAPNRLRHATATRLRREIGIDAARTVLGHSDADTTSIYAERDMEAAREAMERFG